LEIGPAILCAVRLTSAAVFPRIIPAIYMKLCRKGLKNDDNDAEAILVRLPRRERPQGFR